MGSDLSQNFDFFSSKIYVFSGRVLCKHEAHFSVVKSSSFVKFRLTFGFLVLVLQLFSFYGTE